MASEVVVKLEVAAELIVKVVSLSIETIVAPDGIKACCFTSMPTNKSEVSATVTVVFDVVVVALFVIDLILLPAVKINPLFAAPVREEGYS